MPGIMMSMSTMATSAREFNTASASLPVVAVRTSMPRRSSTLLSAKILRVSSSTKQHGALHQIFIGTVQALQHALFRRRQIRHDPMQE